MTRLFRIIASIPVHYRIALGAALLSFTLLRIPSLIEPHWYGDEGIYQIIAIAMNNGSILYRDIWDNKPPLLYVLYAVVHGDLFWVKMLSLGFGAASIIAFFTFARKIFRRSFSIYISLFVFAILFALPLLEGNIANAENFMLLPIIIAFYGVFKAEPWKIGQGKWFIVSGILFGVASLIKIVAVFETGAALLFIWMISSLETKVRFPISNRIVRQNILIFLSAFLFPVIISALYFLNHGALGDYIHATLSKNVGYVGVQNYFLFPLGWLVIKCSILLMLTGLMWRSRKRLGKNGLILLLWFVFSGFSSFFSDRPYTHYVLMLVPSFALLTGWLFEKKTNKFGIGLLLAVIMILIYVNFRLYTGVIPYYHNYINFVFNNKSEYEYQKFFDRLTPIDYALARFLTANISKNDNIFVWSDSVQPYILSGKLPPGKYVPAYHIMFYPDGITETKEALSRIKPRYMIKVKDDPTFYEFSMGYMPRYIVEGVTIYERQF